MTFVLLLNAALLLPWNATSTSAFGLFWPKRKPSNLGCVWVGDTSLFWHSKVKLVIIKSLMCTLPPSKISQPLPSLDRPREKSEPPNLSTFYKNPSLNPNYISYLFHSNYKSFSFFFPLHFSSSFSTKRASIFFFLLHHHHNHSHCNFLSSSSSFSNSIKPTTNPKTPTFDIELCLHLQPLSIPCEGRPLLLDWGRALLRWQDSGAGHSFWIGAELFFVGNVAVDFR